MRFIGARRNIVSLLIPKIVTDIQIKGGIHMEINSLMSAQVAQLQQTLQMSILDKSLNSEAAGAIKMLEEMPQQPVAAHPYKGQSIDIQV